MRAAIVHGHKLLPDGSIDDGFKNNLEEAIRLDKEKKIDAIMITGGPTRKGFGPEAVAGMRYLHGKVHAPIRLEVRSRTSAENVTCTKEKFGNVSLEKVYVVARASSMRRLKYLYQYFWKGVYGKAEFIGTQYQQGIIAQAMEYVYYAFARLDPREKVIMRIPIMIFRS